MPKSYSGDDASKGIAGPAERLTDPFTSLLGPYMFYTPARTASDGVSNPLTFSLQFIASLLPHFLV